MIPQYAIPNQYGGGGPYRVPTAGPPTPHVNAVTYDYGFHPNLINQSTIQVGAATGWSAPATDFPIPTVTTLPTPTNANPSVARGDPLPTITSLQTQDNQVLVSTTSSQRTLDNHVGDMPTETVHTLPPTSENLRNHAPFAEVSRELAPSLPSTSENVPLDTMQRFHPLPSALSIPPPAEALVPSSTLAYHEPVPIGTTMVAASMPTMVGAQSPAFGSVPTDQDVSGYDLLVGQSAFQPGCLCTISGLDQPPNCPQINGMLCTLLQFERNKWMVRLSDGGKARVPERALKPAGQTLPTMVEARIS